MIANHCCGRSPHIIGNGVKPSYGTVIHCMNFDHCENHIAVMNMKGTGGTHAPAIIKWNELINE